MPSFCTSPPPTPPQPHNAPPRAPTNTSPAQPTCSSLTAKPITQRNPPNHTAAFVNTDVIDCSSKSPKSLPPFISHHTIFNWCFNHQWCCEWLPLYRREQRENVWKMFGWILPINGLSVQSNTEIRLFQKPVSITSESWSVVPFHGAINHTCQNIPVASSLHPDTSVIKILKHFFLCD